MHFNIKRKEDPSIDYSIETNRLIAIDTIRADRNSRLTLTKSVKKVFPILAGDIIVIYQDKYNTNELVFKIQHGNDIVDTWIVKRKDVATREYNNSFRSKMSYTTSRYNTESVSTNNDQIYQERSYHSHGNIILIDDERDVLYIFKEMLSSRGYKVKAFVESKEAIKHLIELKNISSYYDLAIIDIRMPHINGIQLYQILKIINKNIKVLFVTALDAADEIVSMFPEIPSRNVIRKPISQEFFVHKVQEIIDH